MGKQSKSKKTEQLGKRKVTPVQIAFIVDRYLSDNNFSQTRTAFRNEASSLISKSPVREAPKTLLSLGAMLEEYICLKEQKVILDQERARLELEKSRVSSLLQGMQEVMNVYNASGSTATGAPMIQASAATRPLADAAPLPASCTESPAGYPTYKPPAAVQVSTPCNNAVEHGNLASSFNSHPLTRKRVYPNVAAEGPSVAKKSKGKLSVGKMPSKGTCDLSDNATTTLDNAQSFSVMESSHLKCTSGTLALGSAVAKNLFSQPSTSPPTGSSGPNTPPQAVCSQNDKSITPVGDSSIAQGSNNDTHLEITPTGCTVITSERITVSPCKHRSFYMERSQCISTSPAKTTMRHAKRDNIKGRLNFDGSDLTKTLDKPNINVLSTSESNKDGDIFDIDLPNLDDLGPNSLSQLLVDLGIEFDGIGCPCEPVLDGSLDTASGSSHESGDCNPGIDQILSEFSSTITEVISETDKQIQGSDAPTVVKSVRKCTRILSPAKKQ